ncbi:MAG: N-acyl-D-amino-acid deacylase [Thermoanaerobaculia bacterium]|jgi:dihydroorotase/N-acyl-D-amino-acid deacylase|nr:N-acyl-D-amino-acid deacylase [Thermoanaerobaculia bacterium]
MRTALALLLAFTCADATPPPNGSGAAHTSATAYDIRIINGDVIDGTGSPRRRADIGIRGDTIVAIGDLSHATSAITIDAANHVVTPGFIDLLGHSEASVLLDPNLEGKIRQGVTTEVTGEGHSPGPIDEAMAAETNRTRLPGYPDATWRSLDDFMRVVEKRGSAINFAFYIGAANPREIVLGTADRAPSAAELARMEKLVDESMRAGAVGMSTALIYPPGRFASTAELIALGRVVAKYKGSYWTHLRNESGGIMAALDEAFRIGREAKLPVNIFHLKTGGTMRGHMADVIAKIEAARAGGLDVASQIYPYTATSTDLTSIVSAWALDGGYLAFVARLKEPATRARIATEMRSGNYISQGGNGILVRGIQSADPAIKAFERKRLDEIARTMKTDPAEAALRIFEASNSSPIAIFFGLSEDDLKLAMKQPWVAVGSDSGAVVGPMREFGAHPRAYGTFPRILGHYVRDEHLFTLEEAVRKMTSLAASRAGFADRGVVREGMRADVVVFDPKTIRDVSTYEDPHHFSEGISAVIVNGVPVLQDGRMTGKLGGKVLRKRAGLS